MSNYESNDVKLLDIYKIVKIDTNEVVYVGQSQDMNSRFTQHKTSHSHRPLGKFMKANGGYGNYKVELITRVPNRESNAVEAYWIEYYTSLSENFLCRETPLKKAMNNKESVDKRVDTQYGKYGCLSCNTESAMESYRKTISKVQSFTVEYNGCNYVGLKNLLLEVKKTHPTLSMTSLKVLVNGGVVKKYSDLVGAFKVIDRGAGRFGNNFKKTS